MHPIHTTIKKLLAEKSFEEAMTRIAELGEKRDQSSVEFLIDILTEAKNALVRNQVAIALKDIGDNRAVYPLIEALSNAQLRRSRGTLLYAMEEMHYEPHIEIIVALIGDTSLEVRLQSFLLFEKVADKLSEQQKQVCKNVILQCKAVSPNEMFDEALALLKK
ncbi:HEAT repeat domain-containing protein [Paenibacillus barcinonensis]|nr:MULTISPECIES: HEAT repeat domain-containing protein [Paenibacillus]MBU5352587.1 HEAT repeat domain-containing protein [Paenibacillus barcinonensis]MDM5276689.1 HEAT repeat domain-containing protein [Paenibacillus silvae]